MVQVIICHEAPALFSDHLFEKNKLPKKDHKGMKKHYIHGMPQRVDYSLDAQLKNILNMWFYVTFYHFTHGAILKHQKR